MALIQIVIRFNTIGACVAIPCRSKLVGLVGSYLACRPEGREGAEPIAPDRVGDCDRGLRDIGETEVSLGCPMLGS